MVDKEYVNHKIHDANKKRWEQWRVTDTYPGQKQHPSVPP